MLFEVGLILLLVPNKAHHPNIVLFSLYYKMEGERGRNNPGGRAYVFTSIRVILTAVGSHVSQTGEPAGIGLLVGVGVVAGVELGAGVLVAGPG